MELPDYSLVKNLVMKVKKEMFSSSSSSSEHDDVYRLVSPSAYDTAWLAMVPNPEKPDRPLFRGCLQWVLRNQKPGGFWGSSESTSISTLYSLTSTLACIVALTTWSVGHTAIQKGLGFIHANAEEILKEQNGCFPEWFVLLLPAIVDLAKTKGLHVHFSNGSKALIQQIFHERQQLFQINRSGQEYYETLMPYLEALPESYNEILLQQSEDYGILIQFPSATAYAFMKTGNKNLLVNLNSVVQRCGYGVPAIYPMDEDLVKICLINRIETLGLAEYFMEEITILLDQVFRSYVNNEGTEMTVKHGLLPLELYRDSLAFRLLRLHGYTVSPWKFCWFLQDEDILVHIEEHHETFLSAMYNVFRASDLTFAGESQLEDARLFSTRILEKETTNSEKLLVDQIKHELSHPWLARLDHLEHRKCIEREDAIHPWTGKAFSYRLSFSSDALLQQLAIENYSLRQSIFRDELTELERWSKDMGLCDMGFARQKTAHCYFAVASTVSPPSLSDVRLALVKSAILVTVADDFFDAEGSLSDLKSFTNAVKRYKQEQRQQIGLNGHSKTIFKALKDLLDDISMQFFNKYGYDVNIYLQDLWHQTFVKWLKEAEWSSTGHTPSIAEYLQVATSSIAAQTIILPAALLLSPQPGIDILKCPQNEPLTNLLMVSTRFLNDIGTYKREQEEGKPNLVLLHMKENPDLGVEESIEVIQKILDEKKKQFLEQVLVNGVNDMPEACKLLHFQCLKAFQMFYNSTNAFDSQTELLADINKAIYFPLKVDHRSLASSHSQVGTKSLQIQQRVIGTSSTFLKSITENRTCTTGAIKFLQGKKFSAKPYAGILSLKMRKSITPTTFPKPKACTYSWHK
ncbi:S-linalool synthase [Rosa chinensis]|uniref:S-linalool synthase n=1 Tax=Rosa chinensis TaxID=74649 RepID=UPI001AD8CB40|nr:S-linalool synthase [Rosa chinensis]